MSGETMPDRWQGAPSRKREWTCSVPLRAGDIGCWRWQLKAFVCRRWLSFRLRCVLSAGQGHRRASRHIDVPNSAPRAGGGQKVVIVAGFPGCDGQGNITPRARRSGTRGCLWPLAAALKADRVPGSIRCDGVVHYAGVVRRRSLDKIHFEGNARNGQPGQEKVLRSVSVEFDGNPMCRCGSAQFSREVPGDP